MYACFCQNCEIQTPWEWHEVHKWAICLQCSTIHQSDHLLVQRTLGSSVCVETQAHLARRCQKGQHFLDDKG